MSKFLYPVDILSRDKTYYFKEFTTKNHKDFVKVILNENKNIFQILIDDLLTELCTSDLDISLLTNIDKLYALLCIRAYNISPEITLVTETDEPDKAKISINVNINDILQAVIDMNFDFNYVITDNIIKVTGTIPKKLFFDDISDAVCDTIDTIQFKDQVIEITNANIQEKTNIVNTLPSFVFPKILEFLQTQEKKLKSTPILTLDTNKKIITDKEIFISLLNGSMADVIRIMFNTDLRDLYTNEYTLIRKFKFSYDHLSTITPAEMGMYCDIISKDLEREKREAEERDQNQGHSMNMPPPGSSNLSQ